MFLPSHWNGKVCQYHMRNIHLAKIHSTQVTITSYSYVCQQSTQCFLSGNPETQKASAQILANTRKMKNQLLTCYFPIHYPGLNKQHHVSVTKVQHVINIVGVLKKPTSHFNCKTQIKESSPLWTPRNQCPKSLPNQNSE